MTGPHSIGKVNKMVTKQVTRSNNVFTLINMLYIESEFIKIHTGKYMKCETNLNVIIKVIIFYQVCVLG